jgi:very-short-patch-repair endonuclease
MVYVKLISKAEHSFGANINTKSKAKVLRKKLTEHEKILWDRIRKKQLHGMHFRRQHPFGIYILDFYCYEINLAIEVDGLIHLKHREYDNDRTIFLEKSGMKVMRFSNSDIENRIEWVLNTINSFILIEQSS